MTKLTVDLPLLELAGSRNAYARRAGSCTGRLLGLRLEERDERSHLVGGQSLGVGRHSLAAIEDRDRDLLDRQPLSHIGEIGSTLTPCPAIAWQNWQPCA